MKTKYILVSCCDGSWPLLSFHADITKARRQMMVEYARAYGVDLPNDKQDTEISLEEILALCEENTGGLGDDADFENDCAWVSDGANHDNYDWKIVPVAFENDELVITDQNENEGKK